MNLVVTCGPAWEPIDRMRRLTNASTGHLGSVLADAFADAGHRVLVCRGDAATAPPPARAAEILPFGTNDDLDALLDRLADREPVDALFHAAALCDFRVARIRDTEGRDHREDKIPSRGGALRLDLEPATKVLPGLRSRFPKTRICGWKYELVGDRDDALAAAWRQLAEARTDACVLNGRAWGEGFALCEPPGLVSLCPDTPALARALLDWLSRLSSTDPIGPTDTSPP
jgi:phosphopantothenoylcysteine synthetase/decarboxylase